MPTAARTDLVNVSEIAGAGHGDAHGIDDGIARTQFGVAKTGERALDGFVVILGQRPSHGWGCSIRTRLPINETVLPRVSAFEVSHPSARSNGKTARSLNAMGVILSARSAEFKDIFGIKRKSSASLCATMVRELHAFPGCGVVVDGGDDMPLSLEEKVRRRRQPHDEGVYFMILEPRNAAPVTTAGRSNLVSAYREVRSLTERLCAPLEVEDYGVQSMPDASPAKWHLAHTTWFFETFVLSFSDPNYRLFHPRFAYLFNSYYNAVGPFWPRGQRGLLSRPTVAEVYRYRAHVDAALARLLDGENQEIAPELRERIVLGMNHEQQHQELLLTDLLHAFAANPLHPCYRDLSPGPEQTPAELQWPSYPSGLRWIGHDGEGFAYDNETPRHRVFLAPFQLASRLVTCGEYRAFLDDGGYRRPELWLSEGWATCRSEDWQAPLYWQRQDGDWFHATLAGWRRVRDAEPVCHVSYFEADAYARWSGARLPTEFEWEIAAQQCPLLGTFLDGDKLMPQPSSGSRTAETPAQMFGDAWQWTASPYLAYPGYRPAAGALGEYNGKFMCNQMVLRGGSCATPRSHLRRTYRNFFPPCARWQFTGIRLAKDS
jgi:ergothioneine biosynthesis protein EgtB